MRSTTARIPAVRSPRLEEKTELRTLRREVRVLREEREILKKAAALLRERKRMRFAFVHGEKAHHAVRRLCSVLQVTPSGYYAWAHRGPSAQQRDNDRLKVRIRAIHTASRGTYGSPRIHEQDSGRTGSQLAGRGSPDCCRTWG